MKKGIFLFIEEKDFFLGDGMWLSLHEAPLIFSKQGSISSNPLYRTPHLCACAAANGRFLGNCGEMRCPFITCVVFIPQKNQKEKVWLSVTVVDLYFPEGLWGWSSMYVLDVCVILVSDPEIPCGRPHRTGMQYLPTSNHINLSQAVNQVLGSWGCEWKCLCPSFHCSVKGKKKGKS